MNYKHTGSIFIEIDESDYRSSVTYGYRDGSPNHAHVVFISGTLEYWRDTSGLDPIIKGTGSIYFS